MPVSDGTQRTYLEQSRRVIIYDMSNHLETLVQDDLLPLKAYIFRPLDEAGQVSLGRDVATCYSS